MPGAVVLGCDDSDHDVALVGQATQTRWLASRDRRQYLVVAAVIAVNAVVIGLQYYGATVDGAPPDNVLACNSGWARNRIGIVCPLMLSIGQLLHGMSRANVASAHKTACRSARISGKRRLFPPMSISYADADPYGMWNSARCPAGCVSGYQKLVPSQLLVLHVRHIPRLSVSGIAVGSSPYRADSGICLSATHRCLLPNLQHSESTPLIN